MIFVHGWCIEQLYWKNQVEYFKGKQGVVTLALSGHGLSANTRKNWTPVNFARNVTALREGCKLEFHIKYISLAGHYPIIENPEKLNELLEET